MRPKVNSVPKAKAKPVPNAGALKVQAQLVEAVALHRQGRLKDAQARYEAILKNNPRQSDALHLFGVAAAQSKDYQRAADLIAKAIAINPNNAAFYSNRGNALRELKQLDAAVCSFDHAIRIQPDFAEAYSNRGNALKELRQLDAAVASYDRAIGIQPDYAEAHYNRGIALKELGQLGDAVASYDRAIGINPDYAQAFYNRGTAQLELRQLAAAVVSYDRAISINPDYAQAFFNRGNAQQELKQFDAAVASYDCAISINPDYAEAYSNRGAAQQELGQLNAAVASYDRAIDIKPDFAEAYSNRGNALKELNQLDAAVASYDQAIGIKPDFAQAYSNRGNALKELKQLDAAVCSFDHAIRIQPDYAEAHSNRGNALKELKQLDAAVASYDRAIGINPDYAQAFYNRGTALQELGQLDAAVASYDRAISIKPDHAKAYSNRGTAQQQLRQLDAAVASYDHAICIQPDYAHAHWNKSLALLLSGKFSNGWELYEWRWHREGAEQFKRDFKQPLWLGAEPLQGKTILLHSEQGLGDTLQFCRYARLVAASGARVIAEVPKALIGLLQGLEGVTEWVEMGKPLPLFDFHCPLLSLPLAFKTNIGSIPNRQAYLRGNREKMAKWENKLGAKTKRRIGLVWSGSTIHENDHNRSIRLSSLLDYLPEKHDYVSLQKELRDVDKASLEGCVRLKHFGEALTDFSETAALCELMDLVISVDTSVAHLSGALGKTTWVLLPYVPDWRWLLDRDDSPWYSSASLYRQDTDRDWKSVFTRIRADLTRLST
jgi:tetratricopeptide (TPR) repeat protein